MGLGPINVDFGKHGKGNLVVILAKRQNLFMAAGILFAELVAGKTQYFQALCLILEVECLESFEMRGEPALAGGIDNEQDLSPVIAQGL